MMVNGISTTNFNGNYAEKIGTGVKRTITDPTDVRNKDAAVGGAVAAGSVGGAAAVASRLKTMKKIATSGSAFVARAKVLNKSNMSALSEFAVNMSKAFKASRLTSWIGRLLEMAPVKKFGAGFGGLLALGITGAQLYSAGDMAVEALNTYKK